MKLSKMILTGTILATIVMASEINYKTCTACHGQTFEKTALTKSKIVKNMSVQEIKDSLDGYKKGEGGPMKGLMIAQVRSINDTAVAAQEIYDIANPEAQKVEGEDIFIESLNKGLECSKNIQSKEQLQKCRTDLISELNSEK